jgi:ATP-dependent Zn protease
VTTPISGPPEPQDAPVPETAPGAVATVTKVEPTGLPEPGRVGLGSGPERPTRKPMPLWDRTKFLLLIALLFLFFVWSEYSNPNPFNTLGDAARDTVQSKWLLFAFGAAELVRQIHYLICEHSSGYYHFWTGSVFGRIERRTGRMNDWNRYRVARAAKVILLIIVGSIILGTLYDVPPATALVELPSRVWEFMPTIFRFLSIIFLLLAQFVALFWFLSRGGVDTYMPEEIKTRFSDVWGQDAVLARVQENMVFLDRPEEIEAKGGYVPSGILLWGPPGTGKTLMAEAVAGETGRPFVFVDPGAFIQMFMGVGVLKVKSLFRKLRKLALRYGGVIVFFDEADSLGNRGMADAGGGWGGFSTHGVLGDDDDHLRWLSPETQELVVQSCFAPSSLDDSPRVRRDGVIMGGMGGGGGMGTLQALLSELSGLKKPRGIINRYGRRMFGMEPKPPPKYRILVMMATNMPGALDEALLRPGRIDRTYKVGYPSKEGRVRTYEGYLAKVANTLTAEEVEKLAVITPYATGAEMKDLVNEALITAIRGGRDTITWPDIIAARQFKRLGPPEDVEYIERERHSIAVHEACHAVAAYRTRKHLQIDIATIEKGGTYLGMVSSVKPEDRFTTWRSDYESDIVVSLASLAGERMFFGGDNTSGVRGDLQSATAVAVAMEGYWGMGSTIASHAITRRAGIPGPRPDDEPERDMLKGGLGERIETLLAQMMVQAEELLTENRREVLAIAHALETHKTISGEDVMALMEGTAGPLVDGAAYRDDGFVADLEEFHQAVADAHKAHEQVRLPLPPTGGQLAIAAAARADTVPASTGVLVAERPGASDAPVPTGGNGGQSGEGRLGPYATGNGGPSASPGSAGTGGSQASGGGETGEHRASGNGGPSGSGGPTGNGS